MDPSICPSIHTLLNAYHSNTNIHVQKHLATVLHYDFGILFLLSCTVVRLLVGGLWDPHSLPLLSSAHPTSLLFPKPVLH